MMFEVVDVVDVVDVVRRPEMATFDMAQGDAMREWKTQSQIGMGIAGLCGLWGMAICGHIHRCAWPGKSLSLTLSISLALRLQLKS